MRGGPLAFVLESLTSRRFDLDTAAGRAAHRYARAAQTVISAVGSRVVTMFAGLALIPLLLEHLTPSQFGIWATCYSLLAVMAYADFGVGNGLLNALATANAAQDRRTAAALLSSALAMLCAVAAVAAVTGAACWHLLPLGSFFAGFSDARPSDVSGGLAVFGIYAIAALPLSCGERIAAAFQEGFVSNVSRAVAAVAGLCFTYLAVRSNCTFPVVCGAGLLASALGFCGTFAWQIYVHPWMLPRPALVSKDLMGSLMKSGISFFLVQLVAIVGFNVDTVLVSRYLGAAAVADYTVAGRLFGLVTVMVSTILMPLWPAYTDASAMRDSEWLRRTFVHSVRAAFLLSLAVALGLAIFSPAIMYAWVGPRASPASAVIYMFAVWSCVQSVGMALATFWNGMHWLRLQFVLGVLFAASALVLKWHFASQGSLAGVLAANVVCYTVFALAPGLWLSLRALKPMASASPSV